MVVGGGIAGLATALHLAPLPVTLLVAAPLGTAGFDTAGAGRHRGGARGTTTTLPCTRPIPFRPVPVSAIRDGRGSCRGRRAAPASNGWSRKGVPSIVTELW